MTFHFGDCVVDPEGRRVTRGGAAVHVSPKAFDLLLLLIAERPRVVLKTDLHARLWPETFVSDGSLAMLVAEVRAALGENARSARAVRTVHKRGYAFQADVREVPARAGAGRPASVQAGTAFWLVTEARQVMLEPGENIIGRDPLARVWLDAPSVSRRHACIDVDDRTATIADLGSKNGTRVGSRRVTTPVELTDGDVVTCGSVETTFRVWHPEPTRTEGDD